LRVPGSKTAVYAVVFVAFIVIFAYLLLTYTRRVENVSMLPTLEPGDLVIIQPVRMADVHIGDIIIYDKPCSAQGESVIHRVVGGTPSTGFLTQGDDRKTNTATDQSIGIAKGPITQACLVGKVVFVIPYIERLASLPYGLNYAIAGLIFLIIVATEIANRSAKEEQQA
jgi:signal peptidase I